jgi:aspartate/methionine/tyrosine aminotransferase
MRATRRVLDINYAIADIVFPMRELESKGIEVTKLYIGDPNKFDFETPRELKESLCHAADVCDHGYTETEGLWELRETVSRRERSKNHLDIGPEDVYITAGVTESLQMTMAALLRPGEEVLLPGPGYPPYNLFINFYEGRPVHYRANEDDGWQPDLDDLRTKINERTRAIVVINPNNPTGAVYDRKTLQEMVDIAGEHDLVLISDEIYDLITYEGEHVSPASMAKDVPIMLFNGMSKVFLVPGWRVGWMSIVDSEGKLDEVRDGVVRELGLRISANAPCQVAASEVLCGDLSFLDGYRSTLQQRSNYAWNRLNEMPCISAVRPKAAFYIFPKVESDIWRDDKEFVMDALREAHVVLVPGSGFDPDHGQGHFRSVTLPPIEVQERAFDRLEDFMRRRCL